MCSTCTASHLDISWKTAKGPLSGGDSYLNMGHPTTARAVPPSSKLLNVKPARLESTPSRTRHFTLRAPRTSVRPEYLMDDRYCGRPDGFPLYTEHLISTHGDNFGKGTTASFSPGKGPNGPLSISGAPTAASVGFVLPEPRAWCPSTWAGNRSLSLLQSHSPFFPHPPLFHDSPPFWYRERSHIPE